MKFRNHVAAVRRREPAFMSGSRSSWISKSFSPTCVRVEHNLIQRGPRLQTLLRESDGGESLFESIESFHGNPPENVFAHSHRTMSYLIPFKLAAGRLDQLENVSLVNPFGVHSTCSQLI